MIEINKNPTRRTLRQFALIGGVFAAIVGYLALASAGHWISASIVWAIGALVAILGLVKPKYVRGIYLGASYMTAPIGIVVSLIVLGIVYYGVVTPIGIVMRLLGRDAMNRRPDPAVETYWLQRHESPQERYFRQF
ncbi:MAG: hypothetical protein HN350_10515 [Phycisphaerales bacterium]|jgi:hypothetical protein|nr:hypothetical protein [Phycisphaerales bacterium]